jgi:hypothetical protein
VETEELAEPETVQALVQFLALEEEEIGLQVLGALDAVCAFARAAGEVGAMGGCILGMV